MSVSVPPTALSVATTRLAQTRTPEASAQALLETCIELTLAHAGELFLLDLRNGCFTPYPSGTTAARQIQAGTFDVPASRVGSLGDFAPDLAPGEDGVVVFGFRGNSCLGTIALIGPTPNGLNSAGQEELIALSQLLIPIYQDRFAFNLLGTIQAPVDYERPEHQFFEEIGLITTEAAGMEYVALRELTDAGELRTLALWGFDDEADHRQWDLDPLEDYPPFARAATGETVAVPTMDDPGVANLRSRPELADVKSFVATPVQVGTQTFGVLSFGASCEFDYAPIELRGFESIANGLGVTIANFRSSHELSGRISQYKEVGLAITAVEVAQAARHEALGTIGNCQELLTRAYGKVGKPGSPLAEDLMGVSQQLHRAAQALNRMKTVTRPPKRNLQRISVQNLFEQARNAVAGRLNELRIRTDVTGPDVRVEAYPDWLRQVFLNLLLNSSDAFRDASTKRGRKIEFAILRPADRALEVEMTYGDNASGINPQSLQVPDEFKEQPLTQQIFQPAVTSKKDGTGFGLWLVRRILDDHGGSIDLVDYRGGVVFKLRIPKNHDESSLNKPST